jgi:hypothetical protein
MTIKTPTEGGMGKLEVQEHSPTSIELAGIWPVKQLCRRSLYPRYFLQVLRSLAMFILSVDQLVVTEYIQHPIDWRLFGF